MAKYLSILLYPLSDFLMAHRLKWASLDKIDEDFLASKSFERLYKLWRNKQLADSLLSEFSK